MSVKFLFQDEQFAQYLPKMLVPVIGENATLQSQADKKDYAGIVKTFTDNLPKILQHDDEVELGNIFSLLTSITTLIKNRKDLENVSELAIALQQNPTEKSEFKIRTLQLLFNSLEFDSKPRYALFKAILEIALASKLCYMLPGDFSDISTWTLNWGVSPASAAELKYIVSQVCEANGYMENVPKYVYAYLSSASDVAEVALTTVVKTLAAPSAQVCISPYVSYDSLLALKCVQGFTGSSLPAVKFLELLAHGSYADYVAYVAQPEAVAFLAAHNISESHVRMNMIGLVLASTFLAGTSHPYSDVGAAIGLDDEVEIEEAVVEAASSGQVDAKINQNELTIRFESVLPRTLLSSSSSLGDRLAAWKDVIKTSRQQAHETIVKSATL